MVASSRLITDGEDEVEAGRGVGAGDGLQVGRRDVEGEGRRRRNRGRGGAARAAQVRHGGVQAAVRRAPADSGENRDDRARDLRRGRRRVRAGRRAPARAAAEARSGGNPGVHGENPILVLGRRRAARGAERVHAACARHSAVGGRGLRGGARGGHHDDAGTGQEPGGRADPASSGRNDRGALLMRVIATDAAPKAIGPYSQAIVTDGLVYTAGQVAIDPKTGELVGTTIVEQTEQVLANLKAVLAAAGTSLAHVVKTTVYLADMADFAQMNEVYAKHFGSHKPARSTVQAAGLPRNARVEIDVIALKG